MRIPALIEWRGGTTGWWGSARLSNGKEITIISGHTPTVIRKRLRRALINEGVKNPTLVEDVRIPQVLLDEVEALKEFRQRADVAAGEFIKERIRVANRLLTEVNLTERETAELLGIAQSHLSNQLQWHPTDTGEFEKDSALSSRRRKTKKSA